MKKRVFAKFPDRRGRINFLRFDAISWIKVEFDRELPENDRRPRIIVHAESGRSYEYEFCSEAGALDALHKASPIIDGKGWFRPTDWGVWVNINQIELVTITPRPPDVGRPEYHAIRISFRGNLSCLEIEGGSSLAISVKLAKIEAALKNIIVVRE